MENTIHLLSDHTINQIAAGEVIENPASVIKELIENAIDAKSSSIHIEIINGGQQLIRVIDDGIGMTPQDAALSIERHATSKLVTVNDFSSLYTMGFRGEALASIAAISKFTLLTAKENRIGCKIELEGGKVLLVSPTARTKGTTIEVRNLFYNVPARKKFQKSIRSNTGEIHRVVMILSLAHPEIEFILRQREELLFEAIRSEKRDFNADLFERSCLVLGKDWIDKAHSLFVEQNGCRINGWIGNIEHTRAHRSGQYLFVNRRAVFSPMISYSIRDAYGTLINSDRHPSFILHVDLSPSLVDVNVHPQKKEVRFRDDIWIKQEIKNAVHQALGIQIVPEVFTETFRENTIPQSFMEFTLPFSIEEKANEEMSLPYLPPLRALGVFRHFLFLEASSVKPRFLEMPNVQMSDEDLLAVDLLAAQEKILFSKFLEKKVEIQYLLLPITVSTSLLDSTFLDEHLHFLEELGVILRKVGKNSYLIEAIPSFLPTEGIEKTVSEFIEHMKSMESKDFLTDSWKGNLALCFSQFPKANKHHFMLQEALAIVEELLRGAAPFVSPRARPILAKMSLTEIGDYFFAKKHIISG